jgi:hypothetical protein
MLNGNTVLLPDGIAIRWRLEASGFSGPWKSKNVDCTDLTVTNADYCDMKVAGLPGGAKVDIDHGPQDMLNGNTVLLPDGIAIRWRLEASGFSGPWKSKNVDCTDLTITGADYCDMKVTLRNDVDKARGKVDIDHGPQNMLNGNTVLLPAGINIRWRLEVNGLRCGWYTKNVDCTPLVVAPEATVQMPSGLASAGAKVTIRYGAKNLGDGDTFKYVPGEQFQWQLKVSGFSSAWNSEALDCGSVLVVTNAHYCKTQIQIPDDLAAAGAKVDIRYDSPNKLRVDDEYIYLPAGINIQWQLKVSGFTSGYKSKSVDCNPLVVTNAHYCKTQIQIRRDVAKAGGKVDIRYDSPNKLYSDDEYVYLPKGISIQWQLKVNGLTCGYYTKAVDCTPLVADPEATVQGVPAGGKVDIQNGPQNLGNGGTFDYVPGGNFNWRAEGSGFSGGWNSTSLNCSGVLQAGSGFCTMKVTGIPTGAKVDIQNGPQNLGNGSVVLPKNITINWRTEASGFSGGWNNHTVSCSGLDASGGFCSMTISGIPTGAKVDIQNGPQNLGNGSVVLPKNITINWRAEGSGFSGGWNSHTVSCSGLDASGGFCSMTISGVPAGAKVDIQNGPQNLGNGSVVLPKNITIKWRGEQGGSNGGWNRKPVDCSNLDASGAFPIS